MSKSQLNYPFAFLLALVLHLFLLAMLLLHWPSPNASQASLQPAANTTIVQASTVSAEQVQATINRLQAAAQAKLAAQQAQQQAMLKQQQQLALEKQQQIEAAKQLAAQQQAAKLAAIKWQAQQAAAQKQLAAAKAAAQAAQKQALRQLQLAKAESAQAAAQQLLKQSATNSSSKSNSTATQTAMQGVIDKYKALILQAIGQQWLVPDNVAKNLTCQLLIELAPGGKVLNVKITRSSGNSNLDRSAVAAVYKASPLPVPTDPGEFDNFRELSLTVQPQDVSDGN